MLLHLIKLIICAVVFATCCMPASVCTHDPIQDDTRHQFAFIAGYSPDSPTLIGTTENRRFVLAGFEYSYRCWAWRNNSISFTPSILPAAILLEPAQFLYTLEDGSYTYRATPSHAVYGFGVLPVGFTFDLARTHTLHPYFEIRGGVIASTEPIPINTVDATGLNFIFDFGGGLQWTINPRRAVSFGYKFLHISNANTTETNPGVDNNVIYAGFSLLR